MCFTDRLEDPWTDRTYFFYLILLLFEAASELVAMFHHNKTG